MAKRMLKYTVILVIITSIISNISCTRAEKTPSDIVALLAREERGLPQGRIFSSEANEGSDSYLSADILTIAYGFPKELDCVISAAIRLSSFSHPCEFAVFLCKGSNEAEDVALFCRSRIDILQRNIPQSAEFCGLSEKAYKSYIDAAAVVTSGRYVALIISSDTEAAVKLFSSCV